MNRLTIKVSENPIAYQCRKPADKFDGTELIRTNRKLGKLEDIEEELGIPLEVLFKALKNGIKVKGYDDELEVDTILDFEPDELVLDYGLKAITTGRDYIEHDFEFEEYGKRWALTKEELE